MVRGSLAGLSRRSDQAVTAYRKGNDYRWVACLAASRIVGTYDRGATIALAKSLSLSVSQVENLARAGITYRHLRKFGVNSEVRRALTPGHFACIGELLRRYDLPISDAAEVLILAAEHGASIVAMRRLVMEREGDYTPWSERMDKTRANVVYLVDDYETPWSVRLVLKAFLKRLDSVR